jgi:hypothetical protein
MSSQLPVSEDCIHLLQTNLQRYANSSSLSLRGNTSRVANSVLRAGIDFRASCQPVANVNENKSG